MLSAIGVDVGGTFTDVVMVGEQGVVGVKVPTTSDQSQAVIATVEGTTAGTFIHGTTAATNTLLEEKGARVALLTDPGFEDLIEIARQDRPSLYDASFDRPEPLVPRDLRYTEPRDVTDADLVVVAMLESYLDPGHERAAADALSLPYVLSSEVSPEFREYERLATTVLTAYLTPSVADYLSRLDEGVDMVSRLVMTSSGGLVPFSDAVGQAGRLVLSGPAGGVVATAALGRHHGYSSVISFDMGGTSTDVCRISDGTIAVGTGHRVGGRVNRVPSVPIHTIGAGGGSIAWLDEGGALRVGPRSAGADPGPAVYGRGGGHLTVTDANVLSGHIPADLALGGSLRLDAAAAKTVAEHLAAESGMVVSRLVAGVLEVVDAHMERALRAVSVEEGADPRESALVAFGGAGGLHAGRLARRLGIGTVLVPPHSGVFSALGLLLAAPRADSVRTVMLADGAPELEPARRGVADDAVKRFQEMFASVPSLVGISADMRYVGQSHELEVDADVGWNVLTERFHAAHRDRFGFDRPGEGIEVVNIRAVASGDPPLTWDDLPPVSTSGPTSDEAGRWRRETLPPGFSCAGPGVVVEDNSATLLGRGDDLTVLDDGTLRIDLE